MSDAVLLDEVASEGDWDRVRRAMSEALIHHSIAHPDLWGTLDTASVKALMRIPLEPVPSHALPLALLSQHRSTS